jgi:energy-coupling factor transporter ATP-binding protein EcfA2
VPLPISISIVGADGEPVEVSFEADRPVFVLGANGTGKSALLVKMAHQLGSSGRRVVASRPLAIEQDASELTAANAQNLRSSYDSWDRELAYRAKTPNAFQRAQLYLYALSELENRFSRGISVQVMGGGDIDLVKIRKTKSPIERVNDALRAAGFLISISLDNTGRVQGQKAGTQPYGVSELSDGERAALFLLIEVLDALPGTVILIDEPERHIHRSLLLPLVKELTELRPDCCLVVATHDIELPVAYRETQIVLVRGMPEFGQKWDVDLVADATSIPSDIRESILGSRRRVAFVEGDEDGIDHGLYNILLGEISIVSKQSSREVEQAALGARSISDIEWLHAWGIIDRDGRTDEQGEELRQKGIWCIPLYSVESIYYHPTVIQEMVRRSEALHGPLPNAYADATNQALRSVTDEIDRLAARAVEKSVRHAVLSALPGWRDIASAERIEIPVNPRELLAQERTALQQALSTGDWAYIVERCPIRETQALGKIASALRFRSPFHYEAAVRKALLDDTNFRGTVLNLLGIPPEGLLA